MIRLAKKEDSKAIAPLILLVLKDMELPLLELISEEDFLSILTEAIQNPSYRYGYSRGLVYEDNGKITGIIFGYTSKEEALIDQPFQKILKNDHFKENIQLFNEQETLPNEWYIDLISVDENCRGLGIGSKLLEEALQVAKKSGEKWISLNVDQMNPKAQRLYEKKGFKKVTELTLSGHMYNHMQKRI